jgi:hypothetical protein
MDILNGTRDPPRPPLATGSQRGNVLGGCEYLKTQNALPAVLLPPYLRDSVIH